MPDPRPLLALLSLLAVLVTPAMAEDYESHDAILAAAADYVMTHADRFPVPPKVSTGSLDSRLKLPRCSEPIDTYEPNSGLKAGRAVVGVRCEGTDPWRIYVPVKIALPGEVVVTARPIARGQVLTRRDLMLREEDLSQVRRAYYKDPSALVGLRATRNLSQSTILTTSSVEADEVIERGADVMIVSATSGIRVSVRGEALEDGARDERIRVKNLSSGQTIEARVLGPGRVEVAF